MKIGRYVIGLLSGLTFGMLFAPKKGKDLRKEIMDRKAESGVEGGLRALGDAFKGAGADAMKELKGLAEQEDVAALLDMSKEKMHKFLDAAQDRGYDAAAYVQEHLEGLAGVAREKAQTVREEAGEFQKRAVRKAETMKKKVKAKVETVKKKVRTKVAKARKTVAKRTGGKKK